MSEKDKVLQQISEIKNHLVDREAFFPYNFNACHVWSAIAVLLTLVMVPSYEYGIVFGTGVNFLFIGLGFVVEGIMTKRVNARYDLDDCTRKQEFIVKNFLLTALFLIAFSAILATYELYVPMLLLWLVGISLGHLAVGYILNIKDYEYLAIGNTFVALLLVGMALGFELLQDRGVFLMLVQAVVIVGLAIFPSLLALKQQQKLKEETASV